jgi:hypothetical protein
LITDWKILKAMLHGELEEIPQLGCRKNKPTGEVRRFFSEEKLPTILCGCHSIEQSSDDSVPVKKLVSPGLKLRSGIVF